MGASENAAIYCNTDRSSSIENMIPVVLFENREAYLYVFSTDPIRCLNLCQEWFVKRFNAAVFENELKWYATEPEPGQLNYTTPDEMLQFIRANQIMVRGHNIFWEDPLYTPSWVRNLTGDALRAAVDARIMSLLSRYKGDFVHWDVSNELLHFDFYEQQLGPNASLGFFDTARKIDPLATLFMNDFNVIETCNDDKSTVDNYILRLKELNEGGGILEGIGLEGHFGKPNIPLMRAVLDKLATLQLPIWLTEIDISKTFDQQTQVKFFFLRKINNLFYEALELFKSMVTI